MDMDEHEHGRGGRGLHKALANGHAWRARTAQVQRARLVDVLPQDQISRCWDPCHRRPPSNLATRPHLKALPTLTHCKNLSCVPSLLPLSTTLCSDALGLRLSSPAPPPPSFLFLYTFVIPYIASLSLQSLLCSPRTPSPDHSTLSAQSKHVCHRSTKATRRPCD